jgi:hypothetical protein
MMPLDLLMPVELLDSTSDATIVAPSTANLRSSP